MQSEGYHILILYNRLGYCQALAARTCCQDLSPTAEVTFISRPVDIQ
jgi:hypothetical protein